MRSRSSNTYSRRFDRIRPLGSRSLPAGQSHKPSKSVLLTRPEAASTGLRIGLRARGRKLLVQRTLLTSPLPAQIPALPEFQAVIASSAAAVDILAAETQDRTCMLYVVGRASGKAANGAGFTNVAVANTAGDLASLIRNNLSPGDGPLLYVAGRHRARDMRRLLSDFDLTLVEVYAAGKVRRLDPKVCRALKRGEIGQIAFYSARAADAFIAAVVHGNVAPQARRATALCLSPRIATRLQAHGWRRTWSARIPAAVLIDGRLLNTGAPQKPIAVTANKPPLPTSYSSPTAVAVPEASMTSPAPTPSVESGRQPPGWPVVIAVAVLALFFAGVAWYLSKDRVEGLQAEVAGLRDRLGSLDLDPGKADRAAMAARTEEAAKVSTALAAVAAKAADKSSVDSLAIRIDALGSKMDAAVSAMEMNSGKAVAEAQTATKTVDSLAKQVAGLEERFAKVEAWTKGASPAQLAERLIALSELRRVLDRGAPFSSALTRASKALPAVAAAKGDWVDRAATGIPTYDQLSAELLKIERKLPLPRSDASGNVVVDSALGVLLSGIQVEGKGALVDDPNRQAVAAARQSLANGDPAAASEAMSMVTGNVKAVGIWKADLAARMEAEAALSAWEKKVLATVGESVQ